MWKPNEDDLRERDFAFLHKGICRLPEVPAIKYDDPWAKGHGYTVPSVYHSDPLATARASFVNQWPADGEPLDLAILERGLERVLHPEPRAARVESWGAITNEHQERKRREEFLARYKSAMARLPPVTIGPSQPTACRVFADLARKLNVPYEFVSDGTAWFVECDDAQVRQPEAAVRWLKVREHYRRDVSDAFSRTDELQRRLSDLERERDFG